MERERGLGGKRPALYCMDWVYTPKARGGAGVRMIEEMNNALLNGLEVDSLWRQVVAAKSRGQEEWDNRILKGPHGCGLWEGIMNLMPLFRNGISHSI